MKNLLRPLTLAAVAMLGCPEAKPPAPPPLPPVITAFSADKTEVTTGTAVKLSFTAQRATGVELLDQDGAQVPLTGGAESGEATVTPTHTSFYVLRASGQGGRDSAFVQVAVNEGLKQAFLIVVPAEIDSGDAVTVAWSAFGGSNITLKDASGATLTTMESGTLNVTPPFTTEYRLRATGPTGMLETAATVKVRPVVKTFTATPPAAKQGEKITFEWTTAGAEAVTLTETTFGDLFVASGSTAAAMGSFEFTMPFDFSLDGGAPVDAGSSDGGTSMGGRPIPDNFPLHFSLTATTTMPVQSVSKSIDSFVRNGPVINTFVVPDHLTEGKPLSVSWTVTGATRVELLFDGALVSAAVGPASANGSYTHPAVTADVNVTLVAYDFNGLQVRQTKSVKVVKAPQVMTFTLPMTVGMGGGNATAAWTTLNASSILIRVKNGPTEFLTSAAAMLNSGMATLHPARTTPYVLEAYNLAGDKATSEKSVAVTTPVNATATPNPTSPNTLVVLTWDVSGATPADVLGIPAEPPVATPTSTGFFEIDGLPGTKKLNFASSNDATASFTVGNGFSFPVVGVGASTFAASTNGFLSLISTTTSTATNADLRATTGLPSIPMLAVLWDDLDLGPDGAVEWVVDGTSFPRRLIVQWNKVRIAGDASSELTFQAQLYESGEFKYQYKTLTDSATASKGDSATVGVLLPGVFAGQHSFNSATLSEGLELAWFSQGPQTGIRPIVVGTVGLTPGFFYKTMAGAYVWVTVPVRVFNTGQVVVNEAMPTPAAGVTEGQYVELFNPTIAPLDIGGLELIGNVNPTMTFLVPPNTVVPPRGYLVLGQTTVAADNGGAPVDVGYGGALPLTQGPDSVTLRVINAILPDAGMATPLAVNALSWATSTAGAAVQREPAIGGGTPTCMLMATFGTAAQVGTPGKLNESCFPYVLSSIPAAFEDVTTRPDAGPLLPTTVWDSNNATVTLAAPFTYFGADAGRTLTVNSNGWMSLKSETSTSGTNKTAPGSTSPVGAIAVFWDDLASNSTVGASVSNVFTSRMTDHQVVQWQKVAPFSVRTAAELNFEAKLFDNGVIELHFGEMLDAPASTLASGTSATVWLEAPDGGTALPISINQSAIAPNTAWRFTPKP